MVKKLYQGQFIDQQIEDLSLRCLVWRLNIHASAGLWSDVLKDKWLIVAYEQGGN